MGVRIMHKSDTVVGAVGEVLQEIRRLSSFQFMRLDFINTFVQYTDASDVNFSVWLDHPISLALVASYLLRRLIRDEKRSQTRPKLWNRLLPENALNLLQLYRFPGAR